MKGNWITNVLVTILIILVGILVFLQLEQRGLLDGKVSKAISDIALPEPKEPKEPKDGYTPIKGVDYFDGNNGKDSLSTHTVETETITKEVHTQKEVLTQVPVNGKDGYTPILQCNTIKNRWEFKNNADERWQILNGEPVKCTIDLETLEVLKKGL